MNLHPIQIRNVSINELSIKALVPPSHEVSDDGGSFKMNVGHSSFDPKSKMIGVMLKMEVGLEKDTEKTHPFQMTIELVGEFEVDDEVFPVDQLDDWAKRNAPLILFPYVREHAFALSARCGFKPMLLPLLEVPTVKVQVK